VLPSSPAVAIPSLPSFSRSTVSYPSPSKCSTAERDTSNLLRSARPEYRTRASTRRSSQPQANGCTQGFDCRLDGRDHDFWAGGTVAEFVILERQLAESAVLRAGSSARLSASGRGSLLDRMKRLITRKTNGGKGAVRLGWLCIVVSAVILVRRRGRLVPSGHS
jgi:hypothetical protein